MGTDHGRVVDSGTLVVVIVVVVVAVELVGTEGVDRCRVLGVGGTVDGVVVVDDVADDGGAMGSDGTLDVVDGGASTGSGATGVLDAPGLDTAGSGRTST